jgi:hypothetical protein
MSNKTLLKHYLVVVGSALAVAFGLATLIKKWYPSKRAKQLMKFVAFPLAVVASSLNCSILRNPEIESGIDLLDADGNNVLPGETLQEEATRGVNSTTVLSRAILQAPVYFLLSVLMAGIPPSKNALAKHPRLRVPVTAFMCLMSFGVGLPATMAIFPQIITIAPDEAESKVQHLVDPKTQKPYMSFDYNKLL